MKILMLMPSLSGGGAERHLALLGGELVARGHDVRVVHLVEGPGLWPERIATHRLAEWRGLHRHVFRVAEVVRLTRKWKPDLVQTCLPIMDVIGGLAAIWCRVPWVLREPSTRPAYGNDLLSRMRNAVARQGVSAVIANSNAGADYWSHIAHHVSVIRNATPTPQTTPLDHTTRRGLFVGRLAVEKNVDVLLRACAIADVDLDICGDGPLRAQLEALARELGIADRVRFHGYINGLDARRREAAFAILISDFEGHPNAAVEALAAGTPMILSDIDTHRELAEESEALFVPPRDVDATAAAIRNVLDDRDGAQRRADRARERVAAWTVEAMTDAYEAIYASLLATSPSASAR